MEWQKALGSNDYLAGAYSYVDIALFMAQLFAARLGAPMTGATPGLLMWRERVASRAAVRSVVAQYVKTLEALNQVVPEFMTKR